MSNTNVKSIFINSAQRTVGANEDFVITKSATVLNAIPKKVKLFSAQIPMTWKNIVADSFLITELNNKFQLIRNCVVYPLSITPNTYSIDGLDTALTNALNSTTPPTPYNVVYNSTANTFTISNTNEFQLNFNVTDSIYQELGFNKTLYPSGANSITSVNTMQTNIVIGATNNRLDLVVLPSYTNYNITLTNANYQAFDLATELQTQLNNAYVGANYVVTFNKYLRYSIYNSSTNFQLNFAVVNSAAAVLGFNNAIYPTPQRDFVAPNLVAEPIIINNTSNNFQVIRNNIIYNVTVPNGSYTKANLATAIQNAFITALIPAPSIVVMLTQSLYFRITSNGNFQLNFMVANSIATKIGFDAAYYPANTNSFQGVSTLPLTVTMLNNNFVLFENCISYNLSLTNGNYNYTTLAAEVQLQLNSVSSGFTVTVSNYKLTIRKSTNFQLDFNGANSARNLLGFGIAIYPPGSNSYTSDQPTNIMLGNNTLIINDGVNDHIIAIDTNWYTGSSLASQLQTKINTVLSVATYTVAYNAADFSFTIANTSLFTIKFNIPNSINQIIGFNKTTYTGANSYKSVNVANLQPEQNIFICSSLVSGTDNGVIQWNGNFNNILAAIPINTTTGNTILFQASDDTPWQDMRESSFSKVLLPGDNTTVNMSFSLNFLNGNLANLSGVPWSFTILLEL